MTILIEKGVALPTRALNGKYPFAEMEVGDSFFVPKKRTIQTKSAATQLGFKFKVRHVDGGCRVWRVA